MPKIQPIINAVSLDTTMILLKKLVDKTKATTVSNNHLAQSIVLLENLIVKFVISQVTNVMFNTLLVIKVLN